MTDEEWWELTNEKLIGPRNNERDIRLALGAPGTRKRLYKKFLPFTEGEPEPEWDEDLDEWAIPQDADEALWTFLMTVKYDTDLGSEAWADIFQAAETYLDYRDETFEDGSVVIFRAVRVPSLDAIDMNNLGRFWSRSEDAANPHMGRGREAYRIKAEVAFEDVNWMGGLESFVVWMENEWEVQVEAHAPVNVVEIREWVGPMRQGPIVSEFDPPVVASSGTRD